ncbi:hypothetical protein MLD38_011320 [Melastoma candidum]|uniref:Uncharacterized protein n=1 Tax=Melastoma candidum TaxID=119954 RepID=A0ACB9RAZ3_9MYRT|nr:hypothetical protein MLD38_011320 [Melastoma candidum]
MENGDTAYEDSFHNGAHYPFLRQTRGHQKSLLVKRQSLHPSVSMAGLGGAAFADPQIANYSKGSGGSRPSTLGYEFGGLKHALQKKSC